MRFDLLSRTNPTSKSALMGLAIFAASVAMVFFGKMTAAEWCDLMQVLAPSFLAAETARHFKKPPAQAPASE